MREIEEVLRRVPSIEHVRDRYRSVRAVPVAMHFFCGESHWYVAGFDGNDTFLGFVKLQNEPFTKFRYFSYSNLQAAQGSLTMPDDDGGTVKIPVRVEWDAHWRPRREAVWVDPIIFPVIDTLRGGQQVEIKD